MDTLSDDELRVARAEYTWEQFNKDLALWTSLTLDEAFYVTWPMRAHENIHPYDVFPSVLKLVQNWHKDMPMVGNAIYEMVSGEWNV